MEVPLYWATRAPRRSEPAFGMGVLARVGMYSRRLWQERLKRKSFKEAYSL